MRYSFLFTVLLSLCILSGCSGTTIISDIHDSNIMPNTAIVDTGVKVDAVSSYTGKSDSDTTTIQNFLDSDMEKEIITVYMQRYAYLSGLTISKVRRIGDFVRADGFMIFKDGSNIGNYTPVVVAKIDNKRKILYEGNSGDIACSLQQTYNFPKELLQDCVEGGEYTIPKD